MRRTAARGCLLLGLLCASSAAGADSTAAELRRLRSDILDLERKASEAGSRERTVLQEMQRLDRLSSLRKEEIALLRERARDVEEKVAASDERRESLASELEEHAASLVHRMEEVRRVGRIGYLGSLLSRSRRDGFLTTIRQLSYLAERDRRKIRAVRTRADNLTQIREDLEHTRRELARLESESRDAAALQRQARSKKASLLESVRREKRKALALKEELERAERGLQNLVGGLAGAAPSRPTVPLRLYKGELPWPAKGKILQPFGRVDNTRFDIPYPGIDIAAPADAPVEAVASGSVVFADWFHGYGKTVCLDHGDGYITVYSHLSELLVQAGQRVARGERVGSVGDTGSLDGTKLYFQISKDGSPLDPGEWLKS